MTLLPHAPDKQSSPFESSEASETVRLTRRLLAVGAILPFVGACAGVGGSGKSTDVSNAQLRPLEKSARPTRGDIPMPQVLLGEDSAPAFTEIGFSLHCGASRRWFRDNFPQLARECAAGRRQAMLSHVPRTEAEILVGIEIMGVNEAQYGDALIATLALTLTDDRSLSASEIARFLPAAGYRRQGGRNVSQARLALITTRVLYESLGVDATPYVRESMKT